MTARPDGTLRFAHVSWNANDIIGTIQETEEDEITVKQAEDWLTDNAKHIQDAMVRAGYDAIYDLLRMDPLEEEGT